MRQFQDGDELTYLSRHNRWVSWERQAGQWTANDGRVEQDGTVDAALERVRLDGPPTSLIMWTRDDDTVEKYSK